MKVEVNSGNVSSKRDVLLEKEIKPYNEIIQKSFITDDLLLMNINSNKVPAGDIYSEIKEKRNFRVENGNMYKLNSSPNYWSRIPENQEELSVRGCINDKSFPLISSSKIKEVVNLIKQDPGMQRSIVEDNIKISQYLNTADGVLDLSERKVLYDTPYPFNYWVNFKYKPNARIEDAPMFLAYLKSSLDYVTNPEKAKLLLEIFGYCVSSCIGAKSGFFLIGKPDSGKSVMLEFLNRVVGEEFSSHIPLDKMGSRFNRAVLSMARVNFSPELKNNKINDLDFFKSITSNEMVTGELKMKMPFTFKALTKLVCAGNTMPIIGETDGTDAVFNRMVFLRFNNSIPKDKRDYELIDKLLGERDYICSMAIDALIDLKARNYKFTEPKDSIKLKDQYVKSQNSVQDFIENCCVINKVSRVHLVTLWNAYNKYCVQNCYEPNVSKHQFSQQICMIDSVSKDRFRIDNESLWGINGMELDIKNSSTMQEGF